MKNLVIFDSNYGNTQKIAEQVAKALSTKALPIVTLKTEDLEELELLIIGSPINGWRPTAKILKFLNSLPDGQLKNVASAAFDTRVKLFIHGDAAGKITKALKKAGANIIVPPKFFYVQGTEGPLFDGELDKADEWGRRIKEIIRKNEEK